MKEDAIARLEKCRSRLRKKLIMLSIGFFIGLCVGIVLMLTVRLHFLLVIYIALALSTFFKGISVLRFDSDYDDNWIELIMLVILLIASPFYTVYCFYCVITDLVRASKLEKTIESSEDENDWQVILQRLEANSKIKR